LLRSFSTSFRETVNNELFLNHPFKAKKRKGHKSSRNQSNGNVLHRRGNSAYDDALAQSCKKNQGKAKTQWIRDRGNKHFNKTIFVVDIDDAYAKNGTVGRNQRKKDTQAGIQGWNALLKEELHELDKSCDDKNKNERPDVLKSEWLQGDIEHNPRYDARHGKDKDHGHGHPHSSVHLLGRDQKRTVSKILDK
jgi:hypothetical protein